MQRQTRLTQLALTAAIVAALAVAPAWAQDSSQAQNAPTTSKKARIGVASRRDFIPVPACDCSFSISITRIAAGRIPLEEYSRSIPA